MIEDDVESIVKALKETHQLVGEIHSTFLATQLGVIAITEQLVVAGAVDPTEAADRMHELTKVMAGLTEQAIQATQSFRRHVASLAKDADTPKSSGLALVPKQ